MDKTPMYLLQEIYKIPSRKQAVPALTSLAPTTKLAPTTLAPHSRLPAANRANLEPSTEVILTLTLRLFLNFNLVAFW